MPNPKTDPEEETRSGNWLNSKLVADKHNTNQRPKKPTLGVIQRAMRTLEIKKMKERGVGNGWIRASGPLERQLGQV